MDAKVVEQGLERYPATYAVRKGVFTLTNGSPAVIPAGSRFSTINGSDSVNFTVTGVYEENGVVEPGSYQLVCEELGNIGNTYTGDLMMLTNISDLGSAIITTIITPARDVETDEELRNRYLLTVKQKPFGGNIAQYDEEIKNIEGVGEVQIYPVWNGGGTVKCSIIDANYSRVSDDFINQVKNIIDPAPEGTGVGLAPIGHTVTVTTPTNKTINISAKITVDHRYTLEQLRTSISEAISNYLLELRTVWGVADELGNYSLSVYISRINNAVLSVVGVANITSTTINGAAADLELTQTATLQELPVLGTVTLNE